MLSAAEHLVNKSLNFVFGFAPPVLLAAGFGYLFWQWPPSGLFFLGTTLVLLLVLYISTVGLVEAAMRLKLGLEYLDYRFRPVAVLLLVGACICTFMLAGTAYGLGVAGSQTFFYLAALLLFVAAYLQWKKRAA